MSGQKNKETVILGVDPGTLALGYGIVQRTHRLKLLDMGTLTFKRDASQALRLQKIFKGISDLIATFKPDIMAIEAPFYGKNVQSMLKLGRAQGVAMAAALNMDIPVFEYSPRKIKKAITGNGNASKEQVSGMLRGLLGEEVPNDSLDATDGLAAAICYDLQNTWAGPQHIGTAGGGSTASGSATKTGKSERFGSWEAFLTANPKRKKS